MTDSGLVYTEDAASAGSILAYAEVLINTGRREMMLKMAPADIWQAFDCMGGDISR